MGLVGAIIGIGMLFLSFLLTKKPKTPRNPADDMPTTLTQRGEYIPVVLGTRRIGYVFGWAGDRKAKTSGGGGKGMGGGEGEQTNYYESAWHLLGVGPATTLHAIFQNGKAIWNTPISSTTSPSGTLFTCPHGEGTFAIFWGEATQPVSPFLANSKRVGIASTWPNLCYVAWSGKKLGSSPMWPQIEYAVTFGCPGSVLPGSDYSLSQGGATGVNPAHALVQILRGDFPHGLGLPARQIDNDTLIDMGVLCQDEHLPVNMLIDQGRTADTVLQAILADVGVTMPLVSGRLTFIPNRPNIDYAQRRLTLIGDRRNTTAGDRRIVSISVPVLDNDVLMAPNLERTIDHGDDGITRVVFTFKDETGMAYRDYDIKFDDDAEADETGSVSSQNIQIEIATNIDVATRIARRRSQETAVKSSLKIKALRGSRQFCAGQCFDVADFGRLRVLSVKLDPESAAVELECSPDVYGVPDTADSQPKNGGSGAWTPSGAVADMAVRWVELPASLSSEPAIVVFRIRAHQEIAAANVYLSPDGVTYTYSGAQDNAAAGGVLEAGISATTDDTITLGPTFETDNDDASDIMDLSADRTSWQSGTQVALIDDEVFFLESVSIQAESSWIAATAYAEAARTIPTASNGLRYVCTTAGTSGATEPAWPVVVGATVTDGSAVWTCRRYAYHLNGLIRARYETTQAAHAAGTRVFIAAKSQLTIIKKSIIVPGTTLCVKTEPKTNTQTVDIATVSAVCDTVQGLASGTSATFRSDASGNYRITTTGENRV